MTALVDKVYSLLVACCQHTHSVRERAEFVMVEREGKKSEKGEIIKPSWLRRKLIWPLKTKVLRTLPFKVDTLPLIPVLSFCRRS